MVVGKDLAHNRLILGYEGVDAPGLYASAATVGSIINPLLPLPERVLVQPRYRAAAVPATLHPLSDGRVSIRFDSPVRALSPGQVCAFYHPEQPEQLLGGGFFEEVTPTL